MNRDDFWRLIEEAGSGSHPSEQAETIQAELRKRSPEEIVREILLSTWPELSETHIQVDRQ